MRSDVIFNNLYLGTCLRFGWCLNVIMILLLGDTSLIVWIWSNCGYGWLVDYTFDVVNIVWFPYLTCIGCYTEAYSILVEIYRYSSIRMTISAYDDRYRVDSMIFIMIPQWTPSWAIRSGSYFPILLQFFNWVILGCIDSHTIVSVEFTSNFLDIPIELYLSQWHMCSHSDISNRVFFLADDSLFLIGHPRALFFSH